MTEDRICVTVDEFCIAHCCLDPTIPYLRLNRYHLIGNWGPAKKAAELQRHLYDQIHPVVRNGKTMLSLCGECIDMPESGRRADARFGIRSFINATNARMSVTKQILLFAMNKGRILISPASLRIMCMALMFGAFLSITPPLSAFDSLYEFLTLSFMLLGSFLLFGYETAELIRKYLLFGIRQHPFVPAYPMQDIRNEILRTLKRMAAEAVKRQIQVPHK